jgi:hypothetical protein
MTSSLSALYADPRNRRSTVLVAVVNNMDDLRRVASEGWYRIPQRRAPRRVGADYLAFYQTGAFRNQEEAQTITYFAATHRYRLVTRRELLPQEADHPRADDFYFRIELGPLLRLDKPLPSASLRRVTFIYTDLRRLLESRDVKELFVKDDPFDTFWQTLRANRLRPLANRVVDLMPVDITLRARGGYVGIRWRDDEPPAVQEASQSHHSGVSGGDETAPARTRWEVITLSPDQVARDLEGCLRRIGAALIRLGGSDLNR